MLTTFRPSDTIQRSIAIEPDAVRGTLADDSEAARVIASLRDKLKAQSTDIENLHAKLLGAAKEHDAEVSFPLSFIHPWAFF
jgi:intracellular protein transport protein USO1